MKERSFSMPQVYLDHAATTPVHPEVIHTMTDSLRTCYGNPSSTHAFGRAARHELNQARRLLADSLGAKEAEIIFTGSGTESDNLAIWGTAFSRMSEGRHIITTAVEHPAVFNTMAYLAEQGFEISYLSVNEKGELDLNELQATLRPDTILVSIMTVNNETGVTFPIKEIGKLLANHSAYFHTDAVQAYGLADLTVAELGVDLLSAASHKINGPKGTGLLFVRNGVRLTSLLHGGSQEAQRRPGTENLAGICGFAQAAALRTATKRLELRKTYRHYTNKLLALLENAQIAFQVNGHLEQCLPHVVNIWFQGIPANILLQRLDLAGFAVSSGSACSAGDVAPSRVLKMMYGDDHPALSESLRISYGLGNDDAQITGFAQTLIQIIHDLQAKQVYS